MDSTSKEYELNTSEEKQPSVSFTEISTGQTCPNTAACVDNHYCSATDGSGTCEACMYACFKYKFIHVSSKTSSIK